MSDDRGSFRTSQRLTQRSLTMKKAKEEDARRLSARGDQHTLESATASHRSGGAETVVESGRTVVVRREAGVSGRLTVSTRLSGRQAASVRTTGGDTIIRYKSGDMVIKRGSRRARLRRQIIWAYALGYLILFGAYMVFLLTGTTTINPDDFVDKAFSRRHGSEIIDLELAALEAMRGNRTPAEIRLAETLSFYDENKDLVRVEEGARLTLLSAAKLGKAIIADQGLAPDKRNFAKPLRIYKETYLSSLDWPYWMTVYNSFGFFLLLLLFVWNPLANYLGTQGKKTAVALRNARDAKEEAAEYRERYRLLAAEIEEKNATLRAVAAADAEAEMKSATENALRQASVIESGLSDSIGLEAALASKRLGREAALQACEQARGILVERLGQAEHDAAVDELIADIAGMRFASGAGRAS